VFGGLAMPLVALVAVLLYPSIAEMQRREIAEMRYLTNDLGDDSE
jgi:hypothetical protein